MRFLNSLITAIAMGFIILATSETLRVLYVNLVLKPAPGDIAAIMFVFLEFLAVPIITLILIIIFHIFYEKLNVPIILFSGVFSLWLFQLFMALGIFYGMEYIYILPIIFFILGYLLVKRKNAWLYINGFTIGTILGLLSSYSAVILWRKIDNTLTSFFWFDDKEKILVLVVTFLGAWIGNSIEKKRKIN